MYTRRTFLAGTAALLLSNCRRGGEDHRELARIETRIGGRLGVFALDAGSERALSLRPDERFAMCSVFKWLLAATVLAAADRGELALGDLLAYSEAELLGHSPVTATNAGSGAMSIGALAEAAVTVSDNAAANLLLARLGGPAAVTTFARSLGDTVTRLDRNEPELNQNLTGDPRDTSSPRAMVTSLRATLVGGALSSTSRANLLDWLRGCTTGAARLRAGLPGGWIVGDKTGTGGRNAVNDVAIAHPPGRAPILIAAFCSDSNASVEQLNGGLADVGRVVARYFA
ncbi:MAG: class A beta-lactamase [Kofleriaceae bacterium]